MTPIIVVAVISAIVTLFLIAPIAATHKKTCYGLMALIPALSLGIYILIFAPDILLPQYKAEQNLIANLESKIKSGGGEDATSHLAGLYIANDNLDKAIALLENKTNGNKDLELQITVAYFAKGLRYAEQQEKSRALEFLQKALDAAPENTPFLSDIEYFMDKIMTSKESHPER